jgi:uncharacterized protein (TIGR02453 family)
MIRQETLQFLQNISENNHREWFHNNKDQYLAARENALEFTGKLVQEVAKFDNAIPTDLNPGDCVMRIYRDIRFSKDKTPYKVNIGIGISANGKNFNGPGYYIHLEPGKSFAGGGVWHPENEQLKAIRQEIDYNGSEFLEIIEAPSFKKYFDTLDTEDQLKTAPKGYPADHEMINYIKLKSFVVSHDFNDMEVQKNTFVSNVADTFEKMFPLMVFLRNAIS